MAGWELTLWHKRHWYPDARVKGFCSQEPGFTEIVMLTLATLLRVALLILIWLVIRLLVKIQILFILVNIKVCDNFAGQMHKMQCYQNIFLHLKNFQMWIWSVLLRLRKWRNTRRVSFHLSYPAQCLKTVNETHQLLLDLQRSLRTQRTWKIRLHQYLLLML